MAVLAGLQFGAYQMLSFRYLSEKKKLIFSWLVMILALIVKGSNTKPDQASPKNIVRTCQNIFANVAEKNKNYICKPRLLGRNASGKKLFATNPSGPTTTDWLRTTGHVKLSSMYPHHPMYRTFWTSQVPSSIYWRWHALTIGHCKWAGGYTLKHGLLTYLSSVNGHFSKTIAWFVRHNPTAKKWMQVILILENQERPIVFAFYKYLLARRKKHPNKII